MEVTVNDTMHGTTRDIILGPKPNSFIMTSTIEFPMVKLTQDPTEACGMNKKMEVVLLRVTCRILLLIPLLYPSSTT